MKSIYFCLMVVCAVAVAGCGSTEDNSLATEGATADEFAQYEEELAAVSGGDSYADAEEADDAEEAGDAAE